MKNVFLIICTGYFGDVLLTSKLTRDIKKNYADSKVVYICDLPYVSVAKNIPGVDEVYPYDRKCTSNLFNYLKFIFKFPYRDKIEHAFIIHQNKSSRIRLAKALGAKNISTWESFKDNANYKKFLEENSKYMKVAYFNANMLSVLTNKATDDEDIEFFVSKESQQKIDGILAEKKNLVAINPQAGDDWKCWDVEEFIKFVKVIIQRGQTPVITGVAKDGTKYIDAIKSDDEIREDDYINMIDKTNFMELGALYKRCQYVISVDTGSGHMSCAVGTPTLVLFFRDNAELWAPMNTEQNSYIYSAKVTAEEVLCQMETAARL